MLFCWLCYYTCAQNTLQIPHPNPHLARPKGSPVQPADACSLNFVKIFIEPTINAKQLAGQETKGEVD